MHLSSRLDEIGKPAWIGLMVLGFILFWPLGLALLAFLIWSGRMSCWHHDGAGYDWRQRMMERIERKMDRHAHRHGHHHHHGWRRSSGNVAFDAYRAETLARLEEEEREFREFLDRLRFAKDKVEFDAFLKERQGRPETEPPTEPPQN